MNVVSDDLKTRLHQELKISPCRQLLSNWARLPSYENMPFSKLNLPTENKLHLTLKQTEGAFSADEE